MKTTRHLCDFCGGEERKLRGRVQGERAPDLEVVDIFGAMFGRARGDDASLDYDMCRRCVGGLLRARLATSAALRQAAGL